MRTAAEKAPKATAKESKPKSTNPKGTGGASSRSRMKKRERDRWDVSPDEPNTIQVEIRQAVWPYLWLKWCEGFDKTQHCARGLTGKWSRIIPFNPKETGMIFSGHLSEYPKIEKLYLCGVHQSQYELNLHVPMQRKEGNIILIDRPDIFVRVNDWELLLIPPLPQEIIRKWRLAWDYSSCRNYAFGYHYLSPAKNPQLGFLREDEGRDD